MGLQVNLMLPWRKTGEPQRGDGAFSNTPPTAFCWSPPLWTREAGQGMERRVDSRKGETLDETPMTLASDGWGVVVGARESRAHQDEDWRRRPLACGKTGAKVPSERASCPQVDSYGAGEMRRNALWCSLTTEKDRRC